MAPMWNTCCYIKKICISSTQCFDVFHTFLTKKAVISPCCILRGPGGEHNVDVVPGGTEFELKLRRGVWQAAHTRNNPHVKCTGVYWA
jgi:hypothetical protein